jgi:sulfite oxidase
LGIFRIKLYSVNTSRPATAKRLQELKARGVPFEPLTRPLEFSLEDEDEYEIATKKHPREPLN